MTAMFSSMLFGFLITLVGMCWRARRARKATKAERNGLLDGKMVDLSGTSGAELPEEKQRRHTSVMRAGMQTQGGYLSQPTYGGQGASRDSSPLTGMENTMTRHETPVFNYTHVHRGQEELVIPMEGEDLGSRRTSM